VTAVEALAHVVAALPGGAPRPGQELMCREVADAIEQHRHLLVQAGTGTGKSLGYLVPAITSGRHTVVVTATKALQEQLSGKDLPFLAEHLEHPFEHALLKGRSNYVCLAKKAGLEHALELGLDDGGEADAGGLDLDELDEWVAITDTGDRADYPRAVSDDDWERVSLDARECPGRARCDLGGECFAELARDRAASADVVVVNASLYGRHLASGGHVLPEHDVVVVDEAHTLEDFAAGAFGVELGPGRLHHLANLVGSLLLGDARDPARDDPAGHLHDLADRLDLVLAACTTDAPIDLDDAGLRSPLVSLGEHLASVRAAVQKVDTTNVEALRRRDQVGSGVDSARDDVGAVLAARPSEDAVWVERTRRSTVLHLATVDVGVPLAESLFAQHVTILTSATLAVGGDFGPTAWRLGLRSSGRVSLGDGDTPSPPSGTLACSARPSSQVGGSRSDVEADPRAYTSVDVGSPFDYRRQAIVYVAAHLPDPRSPKYEEAWLEEAEDLVRAAGGRTLGLCTSLRAAAALRERLRERLDVRVLAPDDLPRARLMAEFAADETSCLVGSLGLWQGLDVPGPSVSLVIVDKIPFARPNDPLASARRTHAEGLGRDPFRTFDLPRAATLLAQGAGRLVRGVDDRGVVAILDPRVVTKGYGRVLLDSLPPMYRLSDPARVRAALERLRAEHDAGAVEAS
jgi:ATP-dependent DNA helicase DinG